jgi:hypothetical protein
LPPSGALSLSCCTFVSSASSMLLYYIVRDYGASVVALHLQSVYNNKN